MPYPQKAQWIDISNLPAFVSRAEREYLTEQDQLAKDDSERHRVIVYCWNGEQGQFAPRFVYHPTDQELLTVMRELTPLWTRSHLSETCHCAEHHAATQAAIQVLDTATVSLKFSRQALKEAIQAIKRDHPEIPRTVLRQLRNLQGQTYFSLQDVANALVKILSEDNIVQYGDQLMTTLQTFGIDETLRQKRLSELREQLALYHGNVPKQPIQPTIENCPFPHCQLPYHYSFLEWIAFDTVTIQRVLDTLIGAPLMAGELKKYLAAVERWLFAMADESSDPHKKKLTTLTLTELMINHLIASVRQMRNDIIGKLSNITSGSEASNGTPPPPPIPLDNSNISTATIPNAN